MKDEIKQMIDNLKFISKQESATIEINQNGCKLLLDYITNLQEENEHLDKVNCHLRKKINNDIYKSRNEKAIEYFKYQLEQLDFYEDTKAKMLCAMGLVILQGEDKDE